MAMAEVVLRQKDAKIEQLIYVLGLARGKLAAYRRECGAEYVGGVEFSQLDKLIAEAMNLR